MDRHGMIARKGLFNLLRDRLIVLFAAARCVFGVDLCSVSVLFNFAYKNRKIEE
jgi:hypothetical protein